jgi:acetyltransferase
MFVATSPEQLARAALVLTRDAQLRERLAGRGEPSATVDASLPTSNDEQAIKAMLEGLGIAIPRGIVASSQQDAHLAMAQLRKPVVLKILSEEIVHKTEVGGVQVNIQSEAALQSALDRLDAIELVGARRYLLEEMAPPGLELIVGAIRDPSFGPTVVVGLGGTQAEALKDTATRLAPLTLTEANAMLSELRASVLLDGWRGGPRLDRDAVAHTLVRVGDVLCHHSSVNELEINPLRVYETGVLALDAAITRA